MKGGITRRSSTKQNRVLHEIRRRIVEGDYPPGSRLPVRSKLEKQFRVSWFTGYKVFQRLRDDGFVTFRGRSGTFVSDNPPHLCRYGLVHPRFPQNPGSIFRKALAVAVREEAERGSRSFRHYFVEPDQKTFNRDYKALIEDIHGHRLAGLMIMDRPDVWAGTPVMGEKTLPRLALVDKDGAQGLPFIDFDWLGLLDRALAYLAERGCTRVGILTAFYYHCTVEQMLGAAADRGLMCRPYWVQFCAKVHPEASGNTVQLLVRDLLREDGDGPAGLIVLDDHFLAGVQDGLAQAGVGPDRLVLVGHANFPMPVDGPFPVRHLGYDVRDAVTAFVDLIDAMRQGRAVDAGRVLSPRFADELTDRPTH